MADEDSLLDVFVRVLPHPDNDEVVKNAAEKTKAMFASVATAGVGPGGGSRATDELKRGFIEAKRYAEDLAREAGVLFRTIKQTGDLDLGARFRDAMEELKTARQQLSRGGQDKDPFALDRTIERLEAIQKKLREIAGEGVRSSAGGNLQERFRSIIESERVDKPNFTIDAALRQRFTQGLNFKQKQDLADLVAEAQRAEIAFQALARAFREVGTQGSLDALENQARHVRELRKEVIASLDATDGSARSFNTLSNNAYQLGQAIEDAAVGFSLNGFAGAVRGSANNVAFLLNNLSQIPAVQDIIAQRFLAIRKGLEPEQAQKLAGRIAGLIPLVAGIGSALAILVLPPLIEWLESLNDIETKTKDISKELDRSFRDIHFEIDLAVDERGLSRSVSASDSVRDILETIKELSDKAGDVQFKLKGIFEGFADSDPFKETKKSLREGISLITDQLDELQASDKRRIESRLESRPGVSLNDLLPDPQIKVLKEQSQELGRALHNVEVASLNSQKGIFDPKQLAATEKSMFAIQKVIQEFAKDADLASKTFGADFVANAEKLRAEFESIKQKASEVESLFGDQITIAVEGALLKTEELRARNELLRQTIKGTADEEKLRLFDINESQKAYQRLIDTLIKSSKRPVTADEERILRGTGRDEAEIEIIEQQKKALDKKAAAEEKIRDLLEKQNAARKSSLTDLDKYATQLQQNVLNKQQDSTQKAIDEQLRTIFESTRVANMFQRGIGENRLGQDFRPSTQPVFEQDFGQPREIVEILTGIRELMNQNNQKTDQTTKAVEHVMLIPLAQ